MEEQVKKGHGLGREDTHDSQKVEMQGFAQREMTTIKRCGLS